MKYLAIAVILALLASPAQALMITSDSVLADPAGVCKRFYLDTRCFR